MASAAGNMRDAAARPGRNDPCPCGSGRKYKQCCLASDARRPAGGHATTRLSISQALRNAMEHQQAGRLAEARALYRQVLEAQPEHAAALLLSGMLAYEQGSYDEAADTIRRSIRACPRDPAAHCNLGNALLARGEPQQAIESYRRALALNPALAVAHFNLGNALTETGRVEEAVTSYRRAIEIEPGYAQAHYNLGNALKEQGLLDEALTSYRRAVSIAPQFAAALNNLGRVLHERGRLDEAIEQFRAAICVRPEFADAHFNLGTAFEEKAMFEQAESSYRRVIEIEPEFAAAHNNLGNVLEELGRLDEARECFRHAIAIEPEFAAADTNLGGVLKQLGRLDEALAACRHAVALAPDRAELHVNLGDVFRARGELRDTIRCYRQALSLGLNNPVVHSDTLMLAQYAVEYSREQCLADHAAYAGRFEAPLRAGWRRHERIPDPGRRLRAGFVSGDLGTHPVGYFLEGVLARLGRDALEVVLYPTSERKDDALTERLRGAASAWHSLVGISDAQAAERIEHDRIDILVDLSGHTSFNRLGVFARKPAPIQVTWLGYFATTGMKAIDYILCDEHGVLPGEARDYVEEPWYLPNTRLCYTAPDHGIELTAPPALANAAVTFGCFNTLDKLNDAVLGLWARLLGALPGARLFLKARELGLAALRDTTLDRFAARGVPAGRLLLEGPSSRRDYLAAYGRVDIALDPFPFTGATTTLDALWMGVPAITLSGDRLVSRQGVGILSNVGLTDWIAADEDEYVARAVAHAGDLPGLAALRAGLRERLLASPLCDAPAFARNLEAAFRGMWQRYCDGSTAR